MVDLRTLFERSLKLQSRSFGPEWAKGEEGLDEALQHYSLLSIVEAVELLQETNFKRHKAKHQINLPAAQEEGVDMFLYALALLTQLYPSYEEFLEAVKAKMDKNDTRKDWIINNG